MLRSSLQHRWPCVVLLAWLTFLAAPGFAQSRRGSVRKEPIAEGLQAYSSTNFRVVTDLPEKEAEALVERLESMLKLVSGYFGKRNTKTIDMYVAERIEDWPAGVLQQMSPDGILSIRGGAGVTQTETLRVGGRPIEARAVVYAVADHGTPQHEAVHAYCGLAFGEVGPVWYAEGMAEVGQYWREGEKGVNAAPEVIRYLQLSDPKPLNEIVNNPLETTGDSWQNYAWRWALCHLLGHNTNYTERFKPLGLALLNGQNIDFWQVYGAQAAEIAFEYRFFLEHLEPGFRVDLCSWDWKSKSAAPRSSGTSCRVDAGKGWQSAKCKLTAGVSYTISASGEWSVADEGAMLTADGDTAGTGQLVGCLFADFELSSEIELGADCTFTAPADGTLFLRCRDGWGSLAENKGALTCKVRPVDGK